MPIIIIENKENCIKWKMLISIKLISAQKVFPQHCLMHRLHNSKLPKRNVLSVKSLQQKVIENCMVLSMSMFLTTVCNIATS